MDVMHVRSLELNLRREPVVRPDTLIASLPFGHAIEVLGDAPVDGWKRVRSSVAGSSVVGFVAGKHLREPVSPMKEALITEAAAQWERFDRGHGPENIEPFAGFVGEMWQALGRDLDGRDRDEPWSAAFISFIARRAGYADFPFSAAHATYIHAAIMHRQRNRDAPFWGFRLSEDAPALGDLVCRNRSGGTITFDRAAASDGFISHCDLVVQIGEGFVDVVGGNVGDSVRTRRCDTDHSGHLIGPPTLFAVLRNSR